MKRLQINTLEKGWQEWDGLMLHACFQILVDYWEKDHLPHVESYRKIGMKTTKVSGYVPDITQSETTEEIEGEIEALYNWWTKTRPEDYKKLEDNWTNMVGVIWEDKELDDLYDRTRELMDYDQQQLEKLVRLRSYL